MNWIWTKDNNGANSFSEFLEPFIYNGGKALLRISADYKYAAYINGMPLPSGQMADTPEYKSVNSINITEYLKNGENTLFTVAWHMGSDCSVCHTMTPAVAYEILVDGVTVAESNGRTRARKSAKYSEGDLVTLQLGYIYKYDFTAKDAEWEDAAEIKTDFSEIPRPIKNTETDSVCPSCTVKSGDFRYTGTGTAAALMQSAELCEMKPQASEIGTSPITFTRQTDSDGIFLIADMGRETCGHLSFTLSLPKPARMLLGWGEHLSDGRVRTSVGGRNFATEFMLGAGENTFDGALFRFGCRYLEIFIEADSFTLSRLGIREVRYPFNFIPKDFGDEELNKIYEVGRRTLSLSAHDHYEDCPWREQALYGMDSRNQMLFGYGAFGEYEFPRANLMTVAHSLDKDGLIHLTPPAKKELIIPSFTAYFIIAIAENAKADRSEAFLREILPYAERALAALLARECDTGIGILTEPKYWNFHEWSSGLDGEVIIRDYEIEPKGDAILTALTAKAAAMLTDVSESLDKLDSAKEKRAAAARLIQKLENYYDNEKGLYASYLKDGVHSGYHEYTEAALLFADAVPKERIPNIIEALKAPAAFGLVPMTFAALPVKYEVLIKHGEGDFCISEVKNIFGALIKKGLTSYPETALCERDFDGAGSLCHGWSAVPCYVLDECFADRQVQ